MSNGRFSGPRPATVAIVAMGSSCMDWMNRANQHGGKRAIADETWGVNATGGVIQCDRVFAMDDLGDLRRQAREGKKVANGMLEWMPEHPGPIYTSRPYPDLPGTVEYPLEAVINEVGFPYLNNSVAYAVAYAMYLGVQQIKLFGADFTYPDQAHRGESGRGCVEWLLGIAGERGIRIEVSQNTTLMDACVPLPERLYGYDEPVIPEQTEDGSWKVRFPEREEVEAEDTESAPEPEPEPRVA